jgi:peptidoglycan/xylan/chitin deacetylase (PgdA/CDA1 family)
MILQMSKTNIPILMYHQIDTLRNKHDHMRGLAVAPRTFFSHMLTLKLLGYQGLSMKELIPYISGEKKGRVVGITFDDGYLNNLDNALPTLKRFGFSATCYLVTRQLGKTNMWDAATGVLSAPLMDVQHIEQWIKAGQDVGAHTCNHVDLSTSTHQKAIDEIEGSRQDLLAWFGGEYAQHFCYPYGRYDSRALQAVKMAGFASATTTQRGRSTANDDIYRLPRVLVSRTTLPFSLAAKILTDYEDRRREKTQTNL